MIVAIIQARTGSTRLPGKILNKLGGTSVIEQVYRRVLQTPGLDRVVIAMPEGPGDDALASHVEQFCPTISRGSEADVLDRYKAAADAFDAKVVVRITSDCPFFDPEILGLMLDAFQQQKPDYMTNTLTPYLPRGLDAEIFTATALNSAWVEATAPHHREHVTPFLYQNPSRFEIAGFRHLKTTHAQHRWTLDTFEDWILIETMCDRLKLPFQEARLADFLALHAEDPELRLINADITQKPIEA